MSSSYTKPSLAICYHCQMRPAAEGEAAPCQSHACKNLLSQLSYMWCQHHHENSPPCTVERCKEKRALVDGLFCKTHYHLCWIEGCPKHMDESLSGNTKFCTNHSRCILTECAKTIDFQRTGNDNYCQHHFQEQSRVKQRKSPAIPGSLPLAFAKPGQILMCKKCSGPAYPNIKGFCADCYRGIMTAWQTKLEL